MSSLSMIVSLDLFLNITTQGITVPLLLDAQLLTVVVPPLFTMVAPSQITPLLAVVTPPLFTMVAPPIAVDTPPFTMVAPLFTVVTPPMFAVVTPSFAVDAPLIAMDVLPFVVVVLYPHCLHLP